VPHHNDLDASVDHLCFQPPSVPYPIMILKRLDAFSKPREDLRQKSVLGGFITLVASLAAGLLFLGQLYVYFTGVTRHSLHLSKSHWSPVPTLDVVGLAGKSRITIRLHITYPHLACSRLDLTQDGLSYKDQKFRQIHGAGAKIVTRPLTPLEWQQATGAASSATPSHKQLLEGCSVSAAYYVPRVGGAFAVGLSATAWREASTFIMMGMASQGLTTGGMFNTT
jgi:hypothetical protein